MADSLGLGPSVERRAGSSPAIRTIRRGIRIGTENRLKICRCDRIKLAGSNPVSGTRGSCRDAPSKYPALNKVGRVTLIRQG